MQQARSMTTGLDDRFFLGCNYWASHAGTRMWADWRPDVVDADLRQMAEAGLRVLRVFPLWPDFQPIQALTGYHGHPVEIRRGDAPLGADEAGQAGVSTVMLDRFEALADMAGRHGLKLVVGLVTGWMSGRLFVPPALEGRNVLTDAVAIRWQIRFVRVFVRRFKGHPAVAAWDLGNECNCMAPVASADEAWAWSSHLSAAIRAADPSRPVVSGMHGLKPDSAASWRIQDQAELMDVLTTHPYPVFTPHCDQDPVNTIRTGLHATAESRLYEDIGGKPCFAEELGTLGPVICSEAVAADFVRSTLFSLWANGCHGMLWWCAYDQGHLTHPPYEWCSAERELGLFRSDRRLKPMVGEMTRFAALLDGLPIRALPPRVVDGVCLLTERQDSWGAAYSSFVLAKQAGLDLEFQFADQPLREAPFYLLPSLSGMSFSRQLWQDLLGRVEEGATLYVSHDNGVMAGFKEATGLEIVTRERRAGPAVIAMDGLPGAPVFSVASPIRLTMKSVRAEVLGREPDGNPAFTSVRHGKGHLFFLSVPIEKALAEQPGAFHREGAPFYAALYQAMARTVPSGRAVSCSSPVTGITEHPLAEGKRVVVMVNYGSKPVSVPISMADGWRVVETWHGTKPVNGVASIGGNDAVVMVVSGPSSRES